MSTIATHSHWPLGPAILAGAVLSAICISPGSTQAQPDSPAGKHANCDRNSSSPPLASIGTSFLVWRFISRASHRERRTLQYELHDLRPSQPTAGGHRAGDKSAQPSIGSGPGQ